MRRCKCCWGWGLLAAWPLLLTVGCGPSLSEAGEQVEFTVDGEAPPACSIVTDVRVGGSGDPSAPASEAALRTEMRNRAGVEGADFLVIDSMEQSGSGGGFEGRGRAYDCPG